MTTITRAPRELPPDADLRQILLEILHVLQELRDLTELQDDSEG